MPPTYYRGCWHVVGRGFFWRYRQFRPSLKGVYNPKAFIPHAALLRQAFAHCAKFPAAASRRSLGRVSVPVWLIVLSDQLPVDALVGRYPTNKLIGREPIPKRKSISSNDHAIKREYPVLIQVSLGYPGLRGRLLTCYSPVRRSVIGLVTRTYSSLDLHALGTPPAFVLSQDQTLQRTFVLVPSLCRKETAIPVILSLY